MRISYLNDTAALQAQLIGVNKAGNAILKVDNTTNDPNPGEYSTFGRNSVLIISKDTIDLGTLVVMDAVHIPFGVSSFLTCVRHSDSRDLFAVQCLACFLDPRFRNTYG
jgi:hypothetical protein